MRIAELLEQEGVEYEMEAHAPSYTARELAIAEQARPHQVIKPVLVKADDQPVLCAVPADRRIDVDALRTVLGCQSLRLAEEPELARICGDCELGAEPPVGRLFGVPTVMDESVRDEDWVYFQAGTHTTAILMSEADWERVTHPEIARFAMPLEAAASAT